MSTADIAATAYRPVTLGGRTGASFETVADGSHIVRLREPLGEYPRRLTDRLVHWANAEPQRVFIAKRDKANGGAWRTITYGAMLASVRSIAAELVKRPLSAERPIMILSDNDLEYAQLMLAAMWAGVPTAPVSPAYSLISKDYGKLRHLFNLMTPGLIFAADGNAFAAAINAVAPADVEVVTTHGQVEGRKSTAFAELLAGGPSEAGDAAHEAVGPDTIAKFLFTSGSTKMPKAVPNTQRMLCSNQQMLLQTFPVFAEEPPVLLDWLPWNHTFGGNHNVGIALYNGGTFYIDEGKPTASGIAETLRNLRDIAPTVYFNVPKGWEDLVHALEQDAALCEKFLSRVRFFFFAGAGLSQAVWDQLDRLTERVCGERIRMITGLGMTETGPSSTFTVNDVIRAGNIGQPTPGCEVRLVPIDGKLEGRFRGPHVMQGYWRMPELNAEAFDELGFYRTGDALTFVDPQHPELGFMFDGRIAEDFKLSTGTFVSVGPMRGKIVAEGAPYVFDAVITGMNRDDIGIMIFPRLDTLIKLAGLEHAPKGVTAEQIIGAAPVQAMFADLVTRLYKSGTGSANRVARAMVMLDAPQIDKGEVTDKGSINQRAVIAHRADLVELMYEGTDPRVFLPQP